RKLNPLLHFITNGALEGRDPNPFFDSDWYLEKNPDVATDGNNPLHHYMVHGAKEGRDPNPEFNTAHYLSEHSQLRGTEINPLAHFLSSRGPEICSVSS